MANDNKWVELRFNPDLLVPVLDSSLPLSSPIHHIYVRNVVLEHHISAAQKGGQTALLLYQICFRADHSVPRW